MAGKENPYLHFTPEAIIDMDLDPVTNEQLGYVILKNISNSPVGFKFRCSNKNDVTVQPATGVLGPSEEKQVTVSYLNWHPDHSQHERLQVLVAPLDDLYHADQNLHDLFKRTTKVDVQEHRLQIRKPGTMVDTQPQTQDRRTTMHTIVAPPTPVPNRKVYVTPGPSTLSRTQEAPRTHQTTALHHAQQQGYRPHDPHTTGLRRDTEEIHYPAYRTGHHTQGHVRSGSSHVTWDRGPGPHFKVTYPGPGEEHLSDKLKKGSQSIICTIKQLPIVNDILMSDHPWRFLILLLAVVILLILLAIAVRTGIHFRRRRSFAEGVSMFGESAISSTATAVAELGESLLEDYRKISLDEYIHWKMT